MSKVNKESKDKEYLSELKNYPTAKVITKKYIFIGEIRYFIYNLIGTSLGSSLAIVMYGIDLPFSLIVYVPFAFLGLIFMIMTVLKDPGVIP